MESAIVLLLRNTLFALHLPPLPSQIAYTCKEMFGTCRQFVQHTEHHINLPLRRAATTTLYFYVVLQLFRRFIKVLVNLNRTNKKNLLTLIHTYC